MVDLRLLVCAAGLLVSTSLLRADPLPTAVLSCGATRIKTIGTRLTDGPTGKPDAASGSLVTFENGGSQISYDVVPAIRDNSKMGDHLFVCLVFVPKHCPPGDHRGKIYTTTNLRMLDSWTLPDSEHSCGGA